MKGSWSVLNLFTMSFPLLRMKARSLRKYWKCLFAPHYLHHNKIMITACCNIELSEQWPFQCKCRTWWRTHKHCSSKCRSMVLSTVFRVSKEQAGVCRTMEHSLAWLTKCRSSGSSRRSERGRGLSAPLDWSAFCSNRCRSVPPRGRRGTQRNVEEVETSLSLWRFWVQMGPGELWRWCWHVDSSPPVKFN